ncbi:ArsR family transcriptional regulator [Pacificoceanicola onchidii]|uniref:arsenate reductase/protein-tyrosine-phosphatase family protein n=1 Tax=Pacificoceanicola onchidii TaxID=2562685 RepID=UPI0010A5ED75|nr:ArsR family transcriptional regulator [Pacificoceanicola onchidii]
MESLIATQLSCLSHPQRLEIFQLLMRRYPGDVSAGEIVSALGLKPSTGSVYLGALHNAKLVSKRREGTSLLYRAELDSVTGLFGYLLEDCCLGRPDLCPQPAPIDKGQLNVVFLCTGNSARSLMAEAILRDADIPGMSVYSAGTHPYAEPNPVALKTLEKRGHDTGTLRAKPLEDVGDTLRHADIVLTVCDRAANTEGPKWPGNPIRAHWGLPDPVGVEGDKKFRKAAFKQTYRALRRKIDAFAALPLNTLSRADLQHAVDDIAKLEP